MRSKWYRLKPTATRYRRRGYSIRKIEQLLGIPRSTLSGWFRNIVLSKRQQRKLLKKWEDGLKRARAKAGERNHAKKEKRIREGEAQAFTTLQQIDTLKKEHAELALALLYLGEGSKKNTETALGSSDPLILKFFVAILRHIYQVNIEKMRCELYIRADQHPDEIKHFWAEELELPLENFRQVNIDKRTAGSKTYPTYKGVCNIRCGNVAIQRKLLPLAKLFCKRIVDQYTMGT